MRIDARPVQWASIDGPKPNAKPARKLRDKVRAFAWAAAHLDTDTARAAKDAAELATARSWAA